MPPLGFSPELDEGTTSRQFFVSCTGFLSRDVSTSSWHVLFTRLCPARHLRTWLTTHTWFRKVQDVDSTQQSFCRQMCCVSVEQHTICRWTSTDRLCAVPRTHNTFGNRSFAAAGPRLWNSLPVHLRDEDISYNSFQRELETFWF